MAFEFQEERRIAERPIADVHAYDCYLKGRQEIELCTKDSFDRALELLRINHPLLAQFDPFLERLHDDPRFETLMERVRSEWELFDA